MSTYSKESAKDMVEEIFWDAIGDGRGYDSSMDAVFDWLGNVKVSGVDYDDQKSIDAMYMYVKSSIPSESELDGLQASTQAEGNPSAENPETRYANALDKWHADGHQGGMTFEEFTEFVMKYL